MKLDCIGIVFIHIKYTRTCFDGTIVNPITLNNYVMQQTIFGFFNSAAEAAHAVERLKESGFNGSDIDLSTSHTSGSEADTPYAVSDESRYSESATDLKARNELNEGLIEQRKDDNDYQSGDSIGRFFRHLFDNKEDVERFANLGRRNSIVSVHAETSELAEHARDIMDDCGAVDIDEQIDDVSATGSPTGSYTDSLDESEQINLERRQRIGADGLTPISSSPSDEGDGSNEARERKRSRIVERRVNDDIRLRERSGSGENMTGNYTRTDSDKSGQLPDEKL